MHQTGHKISGSKRDLAARALVSHENGDSPKSIESLKQDVLKEYNNVLSFFKIEDPLKIELWNDDMKLWPFVNLGHVFHYILQKKAFESDYVGQYKVKKAFSYFKSGFVSQVVSAPGADKGTVILKGNVLPSQKVASAPHVVWALLQQSGEILTAYCSCTAGLSRCCNHVIAILYKVEFAVSEGLTSPTCTEVKCKFNDMSKNVVKGCKVKDLIFEKQILGKKITKSSINSHVKKLFDPRGSGVTSVVENDFFDEWRELKPTSGILLYVPKKTDHVCPPPLPKIAENVLEGKHDAPYESMVEKFMTQLSFTDIQLQELEKVTRQQSLSREWAIQRNGRLTASCHREIYDKVDRILKGQKNVCITYLLVKILGLEKSIQHLPQIRWGNTNEENAVSSFFKEALKHHDTPQIYNCGIFICKQFPFISASPDRIMSCKCCGSHVIEIKCPFGLKDTPFEVGWKNLSFMEKVDGTVLLKRSHKYYAQIQGQLGCASIDKAFFVVWDPIAASPHGELILFETLFWDDMMKSLVIFFKQFVIKYLLGICSIDFCDICAQPCLPENESGQISEKSFKCQNCQCFIHARCSSSIDGVCDGCIEKCLTVDFEKTI